MRRLSEDSSQSHILNVRLPESWITDLRADAAKLDVTLSQFVRACILYGRKRIRKEFMSEQKKLG